MITTLLLLSCGPKTPPVTATPIEEAAPAPPERVLETVTPDDWGAWGINLETIDAELKPGDDFFMYVNGSWYADFEMPADRTRYGSFDLLREKSEQRVLWIIEDLALEKPAVDTPRGKASAFYNAYMDSDAINAAGLTPAQPYLDQIAAIETREDLATLFVQPGFAAPFSGFVFADDKDPSDNIMQMGLSGLGMGDRDYYLNEDERSTALREGYVALLTTLLEQAGDPTPAETAAAVMELETELAKSHWDRAVRRNPELTYNKLSRDELIAMGGEFPVATMLDAWGLAGETEMLVSLVPPTDEELAAANISAQDAEAGIGTGFPGAFALALTGDLATWKAWMTVHFLIDHSSVLSADIDQASFAFYGTAMRGQTEQRPRWKRGVQATQGALGEVIGEVYVERHFPPAARAEMQELVANLSLAMAANLEELQWMGDETKVRAQEKLDSFNPKIGYPDEFETYQGLVVGDSALDNAMSAAVWGAADNMADLDKPVDRDRWFMPPQTVNAYYNPAFNEIVFPAAILEAPFFGLSADPAVNYGAIGGVIGHEMGHGFDDQGAKYDAAGVLADWWTEDDLAAFRGLTDALVAQYDGYCPLDDGETCVNGRLTLGENIGDLGGLSLAYRAYKLSLNGEEDKVIDGLTGDQRFFLSWGQVWRSKYRDEALRQQLVTDPHSPALYRVNGSVRNLEAWYVAFDVQEGDALYLPPEERIVIW